MQKRLLRLNNWSAVEPAPFSSESLHARSSKREVQVKYHQDMPHVLVDVRNVEASDGMQLPA